MGDITVEPPARACEEARRAQSSRSFLGLRRLFLVGSVAWMRGPVERGFVCAQHYSGFALKGGSLVSVVNCFQEKIVGEGFGPFSL